MNRLLDWVLRRLNRPARPLSRRRCDQMMQRYGSRCERPGEHLLP